MDGTSSKMCKRAAQQSVYIIYWTSMYPLLCATDEVYIYSHCLVSWEEWHSVWRVFAIVQKLYKVTCLYIFYIYCQKQELLYIHLKRDTNLRALRIYNIQVRSNSTIIRTHIIIYIGKVLRRAIWHITQQYVSTTSKWWWQISSFYYINFRYACTAVLFNSFQL